jgi:hypothetical protein
MLMAISGIGMLVGSIALLQHFRVRDGEVATLSEGVETTLAIVLTAGFGGGIICAVAGLASLVG